MESSLEIYLRALADARANGYPEEDAREIAANSLEYAHEIGEGLE